MIKLAIITSHPIQYNAPLFELLATEAEIDLMVFYTWGEESFGQKYDPDFQREISWDIPLLDGYNYTFCENVSKRPGSNHFFGIVTPNLTKQVAQWGAEIVWVWGWSFQSHLQVMRHFKGKIPVWFRGDSTLLDETPGFSIKKCVRRLVLRLIFSHVDKVFYVGSHNKNYYLKCGVRSNQLIYAPHAVDNDRFALDGIDNLSMIKELKELLKIKEGDVVFLFAGKFEQKKNPFFLVKMAKYFNADFYKFILVGNGILEKQLRNECCRDSRIKFLDFQNQTIMPSLYRIANFFILPSIGPGETWGLALNESLASGTPVIASNRCGAAIDLITEECGYILNLDEPDFDDLKCWMSSIKPELIKASIAKTLAIHSYSTIINQVKAQLF